MHSKNYLQGGAQTRQTKPDPSPTLPMLAYTRCKPLPAGNRYAEWLTTRYQVRGYRQTLKHWHLLRLSLGGITASLRRMSLAT